MSLQPRKPAERTHAGRVAANELEATADMLSGAILRHVADPSVRLRLQNLLAETLRAALAGAAPSPHLGAPGSHHPNA